MAVCSVGTSRGENAAMPAPTPALGVVLTLVPGPSGVPAPGRVPKELVERSSRSQRLFVRLHGRGLV